jgi:hypothetical protein
MNNYTQLHFDLVSIPEWRHRIQRIQRYVTLLSDERDRSCALDLLRCGHRTPYVTNIELRRCASEFTGMPLWIIEESIRHTGSVARTIAMIVSTDNRRDNIPLSVIMAGLRNRKRPGMAVRSRFIADAWKALPLQSLILFNQMLIGRYAPPVSADEVDQAASAAEGTDSIAEPPPVHRVKTVLLYATEKDYTFAVWDGELLVPIVKTNAGISTLDRMRIRRYARENTRERFGPVSSLDPQLVFEIGFEKVVPTTRRKSGMKLINPRIQGFCGNVGVEDIDHISKVRALMNDGSDSGADGGKVSGKDTSGK